MSNKARIREEALRLNPIDDLMFRKMAESPFFCEEILRTILGDPALAVLEHHPQESVTNLQGRSVVFDARCCLGDGRAVLVEVQRADDDDHQRRMRYNSAVLTANTADPGSKFRDIPDICAVFIGEFDIFRKGCAVYHVDRTIRESGETVYNGLEEVYVNALAREGSDVSELMEVFMEDDAYNEKFPVTSAIKRRLKQTEEGRAIMKSSLESLWQEARLEGRQEGWQEGQLQGRQEGRQEGRLEGRQENAQRMNTLITFLINADRLDDLKRSAVDTDYQEKLMQELFPEGALDKA